MSKQPVGEITIEGRFNGPPASANGGYACGALARFVGEPAEVTLRKPPPLDRPLSVVSLEDGSVAMLDGETVVAEGRRVEMPPLEPPLRPSFEQAAAARTGHPGHAFRHPMSECFVCGPGRVDGLGVCPGPYAEHPEAGGAPFVPDDSVALDGVVRPEVVWGALDCPSFVPAMWDALRDGSGSLLGRFAAERLREVTVGERLVAIGWPLDHDGRKRHTASALLDLEGQVVARARATWIEVDRLPGS